MSSSLCGSQHRLAVQEMEVKLVTVTIAHFFSCMKWHVGPESACRGLEVHLRTFVEDPSVAFDSISGVLRNKRKKGGELGPVSFEPRQANEIQRTPTIHSQVTVDGSPSVSDSSLRVVNDSQQQR